MEISLVKELYSKEAVLKTVHLYHDEYSITIDIDERVYILNVKPLKNALFSKEEFLSNLQEQQLREVLNEQSGKLREVIYQKAFSLVD